MATQDPRVLQTLIAWKTGQYQRAGLFNMFSRDWTNRLFTSLLDKTDTAFRGNLSALYVNDELQAAIYSLRSHHVLHTWVSAYGPKLAKYSPGYQLLVKVIQASHDLGIERIDLSKGQHERYKQNFKSGAIRLTAGSVDSRASRFVRYAWRRVHYRVRQSPLRDVLTVPWRWIQRAVRQAQFP